jgi:hypothetical protein
MAWHGMATELAAAGTVTILAGLPTCRLLRKMVTVPISPVESQRIRRFFATHRPSAGVNREDLVALAGIPQEQQPDFIVVPDSFLHVGGHYYDISTNGQPGSTRYTDRLSSVGGDPSKLLDPPSQMMGLGVNTLTVFLHYLNSWLFAAGPRRPDIIEYYSLPSWGTIV